MGLFRRRDRPAAATGASTAGPPGPGAPQRHGSELPPEAVVAGYHERTKHHGHRFAASAGFLDWDNQPDPFRRHDGAPLHPLPRPVADGTPAYEQMYVPGSVPARRLELAALSEFFYWSLALSAWKRAGEAHWALRVNPSSGNLHPTEGWALLPALDGLAAAPGLYHYQPKEHALAARAAWRAEDWAALSAAAGQADPPGARGVRGVRAAAGVHGPHFFVALSSIPWRESWKYGERAWRYCQHDVGHALAALACSAALLGWRVRSLPAVEDARLAALLGLDREDGSHPQEPEHPDLLALVECAPHAGTALVVPAVPATPVAPVAHDSDGASAWTPAPEELSRLARHATWAGRANLCSAEHRAWDVIELVEAATRKDAAWCAATTLDGVTSGATLAPQPALSSTPASPAPASATPESAAAPAPEVQSPAAADVRSAGAVIRARRSAVSLDGHTGLTAEGFTGILARLMPQAFPQPWAALAAPPMVDLLLFVHRVRDVEPGLYALLRDASRLEARRASLSPDFLWTPAPAAPPALPLFQLRSGNAQSLATSVSCGQDIAGRGAFSLGMLASFAPALQQHGAPVYRHLFWETGFLGQLLYLEAEALGIAGTGIGCFFDDAVHQVAGLRDKSVQSLYHFTLGGPVMDERLTTEPAYAGPGVP